MSVETEIKLVSPGGGIGFDVFSDERIRGFIDSIEEIVMETAYFADGQGGLEDSRYMLRLRSENGNGVVGFKCRLKRGCAERRLELEHPAASIEEGVEKLLADRGLPDKAREILSRSQLKCLCGASFVRRQAKYSAGGAGFYLCHDKGRVFAADRQAPIDELELELVQGDEQAMLEAARYLCEKYCLEFSQKGKHQRAMELVK